MDRISELQDLVEQLGRLMVRQFDQISPIANSADPQGAAQGKVSQQQIEEMATMIVSTSKTIDEYLDSLPPIENKEEEQLNRIAQLEEENKRYEDEILQLVSLAESKLANVRSSLSQIAQDQLSLVDGS